MIDPRCNSPPAERGEAEISLVSTAPVALQEFQTPSAHCDLSAKRNPTTNRHVRLPTDHHALCPWYYTPTPIRLDSEKTSM